MPKLEEGKTRREQKKKREKDEREKDERGRKDEKRTEAQHQVGTWATSPHAPLPGRRSSGKEK